jgi:hypothetical protein
MLLRQQFVAQLAITEVQWNQRLLVLKAVLPARRLNRLHHFCRAKAIRRAILGRTAPAK